MWATLVIRFTGSLNQVTLDDKQGLMQDMGLLQKSLFRSLLGWISRVI